MAFDEPDDDERPPAGDPPPPDDRLWRHPSELAGGTPPPAAWAPRNSSAPSRAVVAAALASAALSGAVVALGVMWVTRPTRVEVRSASVTTAAPATTAAFSAAVIPTEALADAVAPSLVVVTARHGDAWDQGTGWWLDDQGTVAVAGPVVAGADEVVVVTAAGRREPAMVVGADAATGVGVLRVGTTGGTPLAAATGTARAGEPVAAIGALPESTSRSSGQRVITASVSAVDIRTSLDGWVLHDGVQLDRALPADGMGCLVIDADGHLVGVVVAAADADQLAVAVPAAEALDTARALRDHGSVRRAWLGVRATDVDPATARRLGVAGGALLTAVDDGSPAQAAGLAVDDVITGVDDQPVADASDLVVALRSWQPGERVTVTWRRGDRTASAPVTLGG